MFCSCARVRMFDVPLLQLHPITVVCQFVQKSFKQQVRMSHIECFTGWTNLQQPFYLIRKDTTVASKYWNEWLLDLCLLYTESLKLIHHENDKELVINTNSYYWLFNLKTIWLDHLWHPFEIVLSIKNWNNHKHLIYLTLST